MRKSVIIAISHPSLRPQIEAAVESFHDVVATACCAADLAEAIKDHQPDLVISDLKFRDGDAQDVIKNENARGHGSRFATIYLTCAPEVEAEFLEVGPGEALVLKTRAGHELPKAIEKVFAGKSFKSEGINLTANR